MPRAARIVSSLGHEVQLHTLRRSGTQPYLGEFLARCSCGWVGQNMNRDLLTRDAVAHAREEAA